MRATQRLYLTADRRVVLHGDLEAATLLCGVGAEIPDGYSEPTPEKVEPEHTPKASATQTAKRRR